VGLVRRDGGGRGEVLPRPQGGVDEVGHQEDHPAESQPAWIRINMRMDLLEYAKKRRILVAN
jgi:hypothetical protein